MVVPKDGKAYAQLATKIKTCLDISIPVEELTNSVLCKKCYECLEQFHLFKARCSRHAQYLAMRKSSQPDRKQLLRYGESWYWYSCMGTNLTSVHWGCSVVCCPAFIVTYPSGKVCTKNAHHLHKQKMDEVRQIYCNGEFIYDGFRFSFDVITQNRSLLFSCKSLNDPTSKCKAILITNDRSEVLSMGIHKHARETIIESAVIDAETNIKRSIILIRGSLREIALCEGFWYETVCRQSNISYWNCIRSNCLGSMTMTNGIVEFNGSHFHNPVWLKWGALANKFSNEPKPSVLMKVINPQKRGIGVQKIVPPSPVSKPPARIVQQPIKTAPLLSEKDIKLEKSDNVFSDNTIPVAAGRQPVIDQYSNSVFSNHNRYSETAVAPHIVQPSALPAAASTIPSQPTLNRQVHTIKRPSNSTATITSQVGKPGPIIRRPNVPPAVPALKGMPKILHVMSLNKDAVVIEQQKQQQALLAQTEFIDGLTDTIPASQDPVIKQEIEFDETEEEEPETITDEIIPASSGITKRNPAADPLFSNNIPNNDLTTQDTGSSLHATPFVNTVQPAVALSSSSYTTNSVMDDDNLYDLQDDDDVPPIVPIDVRPFYKPVKAAEQRPPTHVSPTRGISHKLQPNPPRCAAPIARYQCSGPRTAANDNRKSGCTVPIVRYHYSVSRTAKNDSEGSSSFESQKRFSDGVELHGTIVKRIKYSKIVPEENADLLTEDPIAVPTEPHELIETDNEEREEGNTSGNEPAQISPSVSPVQNSHDGESNQCPGSSETDSATDVGSVDISNHSKQPSPVVSNTESPSEPSDKRIPPRDSSVRVVDKNQPTKTVQLVKLQKSEQMLNYEGHLYKIKWCHENYNYWECMLRAQVHCTALLETKGNDQSTWIKYGMHNHKVPKPIANEESVGRYQMLSSTIVANVKLKQKQTIPIEDINSQEGQMMFLNKRKMFGFQIELHKTKARLLFANYTYEVIKQTYPGFRWKCINCECLLDTDEMFSIAKQPGAAHNHGPVMPVIDLLLGDADRKKEKTKSCANDTSASPQSSVTDTDKNCRRLDKPARSDVESKANNDQKINEDDDDGIEDMFPKAIETGEATQLNQPDELSDDDEIVLDPLSGEFCRKSDIQRRENRALLLGSNEEDDDEEVLDPLTGQFRRKGDIAEPTFPDIEPGIDESTQQSKPQEDLPIEDFEELLEGIVNEDAGVKKSKKINPKSLAALKHEITFYQRLQKPNQDRNFEVLPQDDDTCWIRFNQFVYELDKIDESFSTWKCYLSRQYACRGKINLDADCTTVTATKLNHCHLASDMFLARSQQEEGQILDSVSKTNRQYTFYKRPKNVFLLKLDDGYFYSCLTISKTDVSCWRCAQRQTYGCKAIITMEGNFRSMVRNRFTHSHDQPAGEPNESKKPRMLEESENTKNIAKDKDADKKSRKRQTL
ncbi:uncharacterized protein LOC128732751 isoform X2 [Sabethes cyaneus]|nr:uncharacterized protein LOC128732751 isoform X2 [Sabethes cyaneus]